MKLAVIVACLIGEVVVAHAGPTPAERAKTLLDAHLAALKKGDDAFSKSFDDDAMVVTNKYVMKASYVLEMSKAAFLNDDPSATAGKVTTTKLVAGGSDTVTWFAAELSVPWTGLAPSATDSPGPPTKGTYTVRWSEVAVSDGKTWKTITAAFAPLHAMEAPKDSLLESGDAAPGDLAKLAIAPGKLGALLASDAVVFGTDAGEKGYGQAAGKKILDSWAKLALTIDGKVTETHGKAAGSAIVAVNLANPKKGAPPFRMRAHIIALPKPDGSWSVVAVHYLP